MKYDKKACRRGLANAVKCNWKEESFEPEAAGGLSIYMCMYMYYRFSNGGFKASRVLLAGDALVVDGGVVVTSLRGDEATRIRGRVRTTSQEGWAGTEMEMERYGMQFREQRGMILTDTSYSIV